MESVMSVVEDVACVSELLLLSPPVLDEDEVPVLGPEDIDGPSVVSEGAPSEVVDPLDPEVLSVAEACGSSSSGTHAPARAHAEKRKRVHACVIGLSPSKIRWPAEDIAP